MDRESRVHDYGQNWKNILSNGSSYKYGNLYNEETKEVIKPPVNDLGIKIIKTDLLQYRNRVIELFSLKKALACHITSLDFDVVSLPSSSPEGYHGTRENVDTPGTQDRYYENLRDVFTILRNHPEYVITTMSHINNTFIAQNLAWPAESSSSKPVSTFSFGMAYICFIVAHRLCDPYNSDQTLTTALLLEAFHFHIEEFKSIGNFTGLTNSNVISNDSKVQQMRYLMSLSNIDQKVIYARLLFVNDFDTALNWNPLGQPLPLLPSSSSVAVSSMSPSPSESASNVGSSSYNQNLVVPTESVFVCTLKVYAIRQDVLDYFITILAPQLSVLGVIQSTGMYATACDSAAVSPRLGAGFVELDDPRNAVHIASAADITLYNLFQTAVRILNCMFHPSAAFALPAPCTALCRVIYDMAGHEGVLNYYFNLFALPNLLKIILFGVGVNNRSDVAIESDQPFRDKDDFNQFYDKYFNINAWWPDEGYTAYNYSNNSALVWMVWRLFSIAVAVDDVILETISTHDFFVNGPFVSLLGNLTAAGGSGGGGGVYESSNISLEGLSNQKIKVAIYRLKRRIKKFMSLVPTLPLDTYASALLNCNNLQCVTHILNVTCKLDPISGHIVQSIGNNEKVYGISSKELKTLLKTRLIQLQPVPIEASSVVLISKYELLNLLDDISITLEATTQYKKSQLYALIYSVFNIMNADIEHINIEREAILVLKFPTVPLAGSSSLASVVGSDVDATEAHSPQKQQSLTEYRDMSTLFVPTSADESSSPPGKKAPTQNQLNSNYFPQDYFTNPKIPLKNRNSNLETYFVYSQYWHALSRYRQYESNLVSALNSPPLIDQLGGPDYGLHTLVLSTKEMSQKRVVDVADRIDEFRHISSLSGQHTQASLKKVKAPSHGLFPARAQIKTGERQPAGMNTAGSVNHDNNSSKFSPDDADSYCYQTRSHKSGRSTAGSTNITNASFLNPTVASKKRSTVKHIDRFHQVESDNSLGMSATAGHLQSRIDASLLEQHTTDPMTHTDRERKFMKSLRTHTVIPTQEFLKKKQKLYQKLRLDIQHQQELRQHLQEYASNPHSHSQQTYEEEGYGYNQAHSSSMKVALSESSLKDNSARYMFPGSMRVNLDEMDLNDKDEDIDRNGVIKQQLDNINAGPMSPVLNFAKQQKEKSLSRSNSVSPSRVAATSHSRLSSGSRSSAVRSRSRSRSNSSPRAYDNSIENRPTFRPGGPALHPPVGHRAVYDATGKYWDTIPAAASSSTAPLYMNHELAINTDMDGSVYSNSHSHMGRARGREEKVLRHRSKDADELNESPIETRSRRRSMSEQSQEEIRLSGSTSAQPLTAHKKIMKAGERSRSRSPSSVGSGTYFHGDEEEADYRSNMHSKGGSLGRRSTAPSEASRSSLHSRTEWDTISAASTDNQAKSKSKPYISNYRQNTSKSHNARVNKPAVSTDTNMRRTESQKRTPNIQRDPSFSQSGNYAAAAAAVDRLEDSDNVSTSADSLNLTSASPMTSLPYKLLPVSPGGSGLKKSGSSVSFRDQQQEDESKLESNQLSADNPSVGNPEMLIKMLTKGVKITKYNKTLRTKKKVLTYEAGDETLTWGKPRFSLLFSKLFSSRSSIDSSAANSQSNADNNTSDGGYDPDDSPDSRKIKLTSIVEVCHGIKTQILRMQKNLDPALCLSVITPERTLDMSFSSPWETDAVIQALRVLFEKNKTIVRFI